MLQFKCILEEILPFFFEVAVITLVDRGLFFFLFSVHSGHLANFVTHIIFLEVINTAELKVRLNSLG